MKAKKFAIGFGVLSFCLFLGIGTFYLFMSSNQQSSKELTFDEALTRIKNKEIKEIHIRTDEIEIKDKNQTNALPMVLFFFFWAATLGVIVYAVKTLSKNKG